MMTSAENNPSRPPLVVLEKLAPSGKRTRRFFDHRYPEGGQTPPIQTQPRWHGIVNEGNRLFIPDVNAGSHSAVELRMRQAAMRL